MDAYKTKLIMAKEKIKNIDISDIFEELENELNGKYKAYFSDENELIVSVGKNKRTDLIMIEVEDIINDKLKSIGINDYDVLFKIVCFKQFISIRLKRSLQ